MKFSVVIPPSGQATPGALAKQRPDVRAMAFAGIVDFFEMMPDVLRIDLEVAVLFEFTICATRAVRSARAQRKAL
jgi:hypothetical protein